jgi:phosphate transport system ATP-binding protein
MAGSPQAGGAFLPNFDVDLTGLDELLAADSSDHRQGVLVEYDQTSKIFTNPSDQRTEDYITGRFG